MEGKKKKKELERGRKEGRKKKETPVSSLGNRGPRLLLV